MQKKQQLAIELRPWSREDLPVLERVFGDPVMTRYLGGPETPEQIRQRHERYIQNGGSSKDHMFAILAGPRKQAVGLIGYWEHVTDGQHLHEIGWGVLTEFQGQGIATRVVGLTIRKAQTEGTFRFLHAFSAVDNAPSNAVCRKCGFELMGQEDFEDSPGQTMRCNDWRLDLFAAMGE